jgi:hypothetical protein
MYNINLNLNRIIAIKISNNLNDKTNNLRIRFKITIIKI